MDVEKGGSGKINIHLDVDGKKYFYDESGVFVSQNGKQISNKILNNQEVKKALEKALNEADKMRGK